MFMILFSVFVEGFLQLSCVYLDFTGISINCVYNPDDRQTSVICLLLHATELPIFVYTSKLKYRFLQVN